VAVARQLQHGKAVSRSPVDDVSREVHLAGSCRITLWNGILWLHLLSMAFFVGGQLMLAAIVVPVLRSAPEGRAPLRAAARRFGIGTLIAVGVLVITGAAMASHFHRWSDSTLQVKLGLVALVFVLIHLHMRKPGWHVLDAGIFAVSLAIVWLGIVVTG
jgi:putative copper export protein